MQHYSFYKLLRGGDNPVMSHLWGYEDNQYAGFEVRLVDGERRLYNETQK